MSFFEKNYMFFGYEQTPPIDVHLYTFGVSLSVLKHFFYLLTLGAVKNSISSFLQPLLLFYRNYGKFNNSAFG